MIIRMGSPRSAKQLRREPSLRTIPEDESCIDESYLDESSGCHGGKCRVVEDIQDPATLISLDRMHRNLRPFERSLELDFLARIHATQMAASKSVVHSVASIGELQAKLLANKVGENIQRGDSIGSMHQETLAGASVNRSNILSIYFDEFGSASSIGDDGKIYLCQLFRQREV
jgi:hypothetical protein